MVFGRILKALGMDKESKCLREKAANLQIAESQNKLARILEQNKQEQYASAARAKEIHDANMERLHKETLNKVIEEIENKFSEICEEINTAGSNDDYNDASADAGRLSVKIIFFNTFLNRKLIMASIYGEEFPQDLIDDAKEKLAEVTRLVEEKQKEMLSGISESED